MTRVRIVLAASVALVCGLLPTPAFGHGPDKAIDKANDKQAKGGRNEPGLPVALLGFDERGAGVTGLGPKVADLLFLKLTAQPEFFLVDRADLKKALDEQSLSLTGAVKADTAVTVGQLTGAKLLITGSVVQVDKRVHLIAKVISSESGRVVGASAEGTLSDDLEGLVAQLAHGITGVTIKQRDRLVPAPVPVADRIAALNRKLGKAARPTLAVRVIERHVGQPTAAPAAQTEVTKRARDLAFEVIDLDAGGENRADVFVTGEGLSEAAGRVGPLVSVRARVELKAIDRRTGKVLAVDRHTAVVVDLSEQIAGRTAIQSAAALLIERVLPQLVTAENKR
ncbi:CsgG/HfaB family protein [Gemmata sp. JC717]|uniref:CsgG/HfaB family protein n=1 Tax=Gemmata algarum TaxID=2975278 RepID=UPI0021BA8944|nr:CsgG/HfaB family protein [Gemmata algarum]MDY3553727.1 CsgG/HfaB family protein [Gemmata algarum]